MSTSNIESDPFYILRRAHIAGWIDDGLTEPLAEIVKRAQAFLDAQEKEDSSQELAGIRGLRGRI